MTDTGKRDDRSNQNRRDFRADLDSFDVQQLKRLLILEIY